MPHDSRGPSPLSRLGGPLFVQGMAGLGDTIYQRPCVLNQFDVYDHVYLQTPWPELYRGTAVRPVQFRALALRTQNLSWKAWGGEWWDPPEGVKVRVARYTLHASGRNIAVDIARSFRPDPRYRMALPSFVEEHPLIFAYGKPVAVVRPNTLRKEWMAPARNCRPDYIVQAAELLRDLGYHVVTVAHLEEGKEWLEDGVEVPADVDYTHGELSTSELCALVESAAVVVSSLGFALPMSLAYRTPVVVVLGGLMRFSHPRTLMDPRMPRCAAFVFPDSPCGCDNIIHEWCDKTITEFRAQLAGELAGLGLPVPSAVV